MRLKNVIMQKMLSLTWKNFVVNFLVENVKSKHVNFQSIVGWNIMYCGLPDKLINCQMSITYWQVA